MLNNLRTKARGAWQAVTSALIAVPLAPGEVEAVILRGITLEQAGRYDAARAAYKEAMKRKPADERAKKLLAQLNTTADAQR